MFCLTPPRLVWVLGDKMESTWLKKQPKHSSKSTSNILEKSTKSGPKSSPKCSKIEVWGGLGRLLEPIGASWPCFGASWGCFGASWARLGRLRGILGGVLGRPGLSWGGYKRLLERVRASWGSLGPDFRGKGMLN